jgi:glutathionyl-hydroquinone reductase
MDHYEMYKYQKFCHSIGIKIYPVTTDSITARIVIEENGKIIKRGDKLFPQFLRKKDRNTQVKKTNPELYETIMKLYKSIFDKRNNL